MPGLLYINSEACVLELALGIPAEGSNHRVRVFNVLGLRNYTSSILLCYAILIILLGRFIFRVSGKS